MKISIIEDNPDHLELILHAIEEAFPDTEWIRRSRTLSPGLQDLKTHPPDVLLCDLNLPDSPVDDTVAALSNLESESAVVVLTSHYDDEQAQSLLHGGIQDFLPKDEINPHLRARVCRYARERQHLYNEVRRAALFDGLTGLPNRAFCVERLKQAMREAERRTEMLALACIDLDGFKAVNDTYGHEAGDRLLCRAGERLQSCVRRSDFCARIGGDELAWVITQVKDLPATLDAVEVMRAHLSEPYGLSVDGRTVTATIGASIGVAVFPHHGKTLEHLMRHADQAMYRAKRAGKGRVFLYEPTGGIA